MLRKELKVTMEKKYGESLPSFELLLNAQSSEDITPYNLMNSMDDLGGRRSPKKHLDSLIKTISPEPDERGVTS